ncbi:zinc ribbon domain-containing protein [Streptomyces sp. NPDC005708]|uniref:zinc ribbon domain-containing protein n=1 Tax=Streptomyces sp. NPDC005708 TaxID=3154564 RepID=UPI0033DA378B
MLRNRRLARKIADAGFGEIRRQLTYKGRRNACRIVVADRWFPSSKTCSACGAVKAELPLHARIFDCAVCPLVKDRGRERSTQPRRSCGDGSNWYRSGRRPGRVSAEASWSRPEDPHTRPRHPARTGRPGGATLPHQRQTETRDRTQAEALTLGDVTDLPGRNARKVVNSQRSRQRQGRHAYSIFL